MVELLGGPAPTALELANRTGVFRTSASRALHRLAEKGLVYKDGEGWRLTDVGVAQGHVAKLQIELRRAQGEQRGE